MQSLITSSAGTGIQNSAALRMSHFPGPWARQMPLPGMDVWSGQRSCVKREKRRHKPSDLVRLHSYPQIIALVRHELGHDPAETKFMAQCLEKGLALFYSVRDLPGFHLHSWYSILVNQLCLDRIAFRESVKKAVTVAYHPVRRYAYQKTQNAFQADDIAQAAILKALTKWHLFQPGKNFQDSVNRWVCRIAENIFLDHKRKAETVRTVYVEEHFEPEQETELTDSFEYDKLQMAVNELPKMQKAVILMMAEGNRIRQVAERLGITQGYAKLLRSEAQVRLARFNRQKVKMI